MIIGHGTFVNPSDSVAGKLWRERERERKTGVL